MKNSLRPLVLLFFILIITSPASSQLLTGTWEGTAKSKVEGRNTKVDMEVKLVMKGNKILGSVYHYEGPGFHHRYSIIGNYNPATKEIFWQEEVLLLEESPKFFYVDPKADRRMYRGTVSIGADSTITISVDVILRSDTTKVMSLVVQRNNNPSIFSDEWDYAIEKSAEGQLSVATIDSIAAVAKPYNQKDYVEAMKRVIKERKEEKKALADKEAKEKEAAKLAKLDESKRTKEQNQATVDSLKNVKELQDMAKREEARRLKEEQKEREDSIRTAKALAKDLAVKEEQLRKEQNKAKQDSIRRSIALAKEQAAKEDVARKEARAKEEIERQKQKMITDNTKLSNADLAIKKKFDERSKTLVTEVLAVGDSIEIRLFDNGVVDGDSISLFLNGQMLEKNIGLTTRAHLIKLSVKDLPESSELTMVAENMGTIPPNTALMIVVSGEERYQVRMESTENSSAMIRLKKKK